MSHKILQLKHKLNDFKQRDLGNREDSKWLARLYSMGIISEHGDLIIENIDDIN